MTTQASSKVRSRIDQLLAKADKALTRMHYFECQSRCLEALDKAMASLEYDLIAQACMPLLEARRQIRVAAVESGRLEVIDGELPKPGDIESGVYLLAPPRVGIDGRRLREAADERKVPVLALVREPPTQTGLVPVVVISRRTIRTLVSPYDELTVDWVLAAGDALGDAAMDVIDQEMSVTDQVEYLLACVQTHPDHEGLHHRLADTACEATRLGSDKAPAAPAPARAAAPPADELADDDIEDDGHEIL
ncbi:MAG: hypothetical protein KAS72_15240 [Phycisphaerales bacterium]|nr:hypothetical protein [Phycisphaerales bacterium]